MPSPLELLRRMLAGAKNIPVVDIENDDKLLRAMRAAGKNRDVVFRADPVRSITDKAQRIDEQMFTASKDPLFAGMFGEQVRVLQHPELRNLPYIDIYRTDIDPYYQDILGLLSLQRHELPTGFGQGALQRLQQAKELGGVRIHPNETLFFGGQQGVGRLKDLE